MPATYYYSREEGKGGGKRLATEGAEGTDIRSRQDKGTISGVASVHRIGDMKGYFVQFPFPSSPSLRQTASARLFMQMRLLTQKKFLLRSCSLPRQWDGCNFCLLLTWPGPIPPPLPLMASARWQQDRRCLFAVRMRNTPARVGSTN